MKFLIDVSMGFAVDEFMKRNNYDAVCVRDIDPRMDDDKILSLAYKENRIVVTMDKDFGELVYKYSSKHKGVLLLRLEDESAEEKLKTLSHILSNYSEQLQNNVCTYKNNILRIRN